VDEDKRVGAGGIVEGVIEDVTEEGVVIKDVETEGVVIEDGVVDGLVINGVVLL